MIEETRVRWLDVCRSFAIGLVLLSHGRVLLIPAAPWTQTFKFGGFLGVELFFVLSGFLIGSIMIKEIGRSTTALGWIPNFWCRRWLRTIPNYLLFILLNIFLASNVRPNAIPNLLPYLTFTQNLTSPHPAFFGEAWSLAIEEIFYLIIPLVFLCFMKFINNSSRVIFTAAIFIIIICTCARAGVAVEYNPTFNSIRSTALLRLDALMIGVLGAIAIRHAKYARGVKLLSALAAPLFILSAVITSASDAAMDESLLLRIFMFNIASIGCAGLIISFLHLRIPNSLDRVTSRIARWSYSAYLTNLPVLFTIRYFFPAEHVGIAAIALWFCYVGGTLLTAFLTYRFFETRFLDIREKLFPSRRPDKAVMRVCSAEKI